MGQAANVTNKDTALDTVITNALIVDAVTGIIKADVGIKAGVDVHYFFPRNSPEEDICHTAQKKQQHKTDEVVDKDRVKL